MRDIFGSGILVYTLSSTFPSLSPCLTRIILRGLGGTTTGDATAVAGFFSRNLAWPFSSIGSVWLWQQWIREHVFVLEFGFVLGLIC